MFCLSYYWLHSPFNKFRDKGRTVSAWKRGSREEREGVGVSTIFNKVSLLKCWPEIHLSLRENQSDFSHIP
jgi:hypothetical protein